MNNKVLQNYNALAQNLGLKFDAEGGAIYGKRGTYDVTIYAQNTSYPYMLTVTVSAQRQGGPLSKDICKNFKRENKPVSALVQNGSIFTMSLKNYVKQEVLLDNLNQVLNAFVNFLRTEGFQNCCQSCGCENTSTCYVAGSYMHLCPTCFAKLQNDTTMTYAQKNNRSENVIGGIVGALLGSLLGAASIIIFSQLGYVAVVSGIIMAICTLKGYELLGGKLTKKGIIISIVMMLVMTLFGDRLDWAIVIAQQAEIDFLTAFRIFPELLQEGIVEMSVYVGNLIIQYLFVVLGAVPTILSTIKNHKIQNRIYCLDGVMHNSTSESFE